MKKLFTYIAAALVCMPMGVQGQECPTVTGKSTINDDCERLDLPWSEGFETLVWGIDDSDFESNCWNQLNLNDWQYNYPQVYITNENEFVKTGSKAIYILASTNNDGYLILPKFKAQLNTLRISFWHKELHLEKSVALTIGYMTDITQPETFSPIKEFTRSTEWTEEVDFHLDDIPSTAAYYGRIAFKLGKISLPNPDESGIDDITISAIPDYDYRYFKFDANGGNGSMDAQEVKNGETLKPNTFTRDGYVFLGWALEPSGSVKYADGAAVTVTEGEQLTMTLYAKWQYMIAQRPAVIPHLLYKQGQQQALVTAGAVVPEMKMEYKLQNGDWSETVPQAEAVGNYYVYYRVQNESRIPTDTLIASIYASEGTVIPSHEDYAATDISVLAKQEGENTDDDQAGNLLDGNTSTKWCSLTYGIDIYTDRPKDMVVWKTTEPVRMVSYTLTTGNDTHSYPNRNWSSWTLYGGNFSSDEAAAAALRTETGWTIIDNQIQDSVLQDVNKKDYQFVCNNPGTYRYYRLVIHDIKFLQGDKQDNIQQMAELTMGIGENTPTGMEETNANAKAVKILRNGQLYILRDGKKYNIIGVEIR